MKLLDETKWLCENSRALEKYAGKFVIVDLKTGVITETLAKITSKKAPFMFHVPSKDECRAPIPVFKRLEN